MSECNSNQNKLPRPMALHLQTNEPLYQALKKRILRERRKIKEKKEKDNRRKDKEIKKQHKIAKKIRRLEKKAAKLKNVKYQMQLQLEKLLSQERCSNNHANKQNTISSERQKVQNDFIPAPSNSLTPQEYQRSKVHVEELQHQPTVSFSDSSPGTAYSTLAIRNGPPHRPMNHPHPLEGQNTNLFEGQYYSAPYRPSVHPMFYGGTFGIQQPQSTNGGVAYSYPTGQPIFVPFSQQMIPAINYTQFQPHHTMSGIHNLALIEHIVPVPYAITPLQQPERRVFYG